MSRQDSVRRATTVALVVLCLVLVPGWASAKFLASGTGAIEVGTARLSPPTAISGTASCNYSGFLVYRESVRFTITGSTGGAPQNAAFQYRILRNGEQVGEVETSTSRSITISREGELSGGGAVTWGIAVATSASRWTSTTEITRSFRCTFLDRSDSF